jgi:FHA domain/zinc-ribbon domain
MSTVTCAHCGSELPTGALFCGECGRSVAKKSSESKKSTESKKAPESKKSDTVITEPAISAEQVFTETPFVAHPLAYVDLEATRIVSSIPTGQRFVLQFSTGESVTVFGTGLIGRHPVAEPGEYFDHYVTIVDPSKSVSKTHLEFGQTSGAFWVSDRHSGNGTMVREPDSDARRCDAGKRYRVMRGTRIAIGEQFFVVS